MTFANIYVWTLKECTKTQTPFFYINILNICFVVCQEGCHKNSNIGLNFN